MKLPSPERVGLLGLVFCAVWVCAALVAVIAPRSGANPYLIFSLLVGCPVVVGCAIMRMLSDWTGTKARAELSKLEAELAFAQKRLAECQAAPQRDHRHLGYFSAKAEVLGRWVAAERHRLLGADVTSAERGDQPLDDSLALSK